ncbi:hypothetical protein ITP53_33100 [Nonomuraea sp. K274]|uniref:Uncharacterized protein n=1 Tax=Nonomuraea cypriaca TaxID=1187855 RepID=A0A931AHM4_9ACTN|nr:hypothetical protein [Nonomuraea cypriaca]MBF8190469.1 hypothetical protein [Nonomuraea cypriaca]
MARDENDRPYEDGQGRSLNPEMTGDVLSPRWSTEDTDEQPAIQVVGNETYILPIGKSEPQLIEGPRDVLDDPHDVLGATSGPRDVSAQGGQHDPSAPSGPHDLSAPGSPYDVLGASSGPHDLLDGPGEQRDLLEGPGEQRDVFDGPSGSHRVADENPYLPLDRGYEGDEDDGREEEPKRGFLGSGWSGDEHDRDSGGDQEVRRRGRVLLVAAAAVVLLGVGAGWMLTGTSSDDPCAGGQCASAGEVTSPSESADAEEPLPDLPEDEFTDEPTDSVTDGPSEPETETGTPPVGRPQPAQPETSKRPTPTRVGEPTAKPSDKATRAPQPRSEMKDTDPSQAQVQRPADESARQQPENNREDTGQPDTQAPPQTQAPVPTPTEEERKGLLDILFPWAS